jgi:hypothetical protein
MCAALDGIVDQLIDGIAYGYADFSLKPGKYLGYGTNVSNRSKGFTLAGGKATHGSSVKVK